MTNCLTGWLVGCLTWVWQVVVDGTVEWFCNGQPQGSCGVGSLLSGEHTSSSSNMLLGTRSLLMLLSGNV